jgi:hypothetical protein
MVNGATVDGDGLIASRSVAVHVFTGSVVTELDIQGSVGWPAGGVAVQPNLPSVRSQSLVRSSPSSRVMGS